MDKKQVQSILSAPVSFVRESTPAEKQIFADKKMSWIYTFGLASGQQFVCYLSKDREPYMDFRAVPEHNLLPEIKEIQWGYDNSVYFGPGLSEDERRIMRVLRSENVPQEHIDFYEECLGATPPESLYDYKTQKNYIGVYRMGDGSRRLAFSHPLREKALELKKYLTEKENAIGALKRYALETKKAEEHLQNAQQNLKQILTPQKRGGVEVVIKVQQQKRR